MPDVLRFPVQPNAVTLLVSELRDFAEACRRARVMAEQAKRDDARRIAHKSQGVIATILPVRRGVDD